MASEKAMYWMAVCVLALGVANGFVSEHTGWADRLADGSLSLLDRVSETATRYAGVVAMRLDGDNLNLGNLDLRNLNLSDRDGGNRLLARAEISAVRAQARLACVEGTVARRQGEMARIQAQRIRARVREQAFREFIAGPREKLVIDVPETPEVSTDESY
jgi:hypothetical protein